MLLRIFCTVSGLFSLTPAFAHPEGAPWGSSDPDTFQSCAACHFDNEPVGRSPAITVSGLPEYATPGADYELSLRFETAGAVHAGFLLSASSGAFEAVGEFLEARGAEIRSLKPQTPKNGAVVWVFRWRADEGGDGDVTFKAAANGADGDRSPFGDKIHFRKFDVLMRETSE